MLSNLRDAFIGQSRSPNIIIQFHILGIVTLSFRRAVFTVFDFEIVVTLKSGKRSLKVIESGTIRKIVHGFL